MAEQDADAKAEARRRKKWPTVLVAIPGWPSQDPGRRMLYSVRPTPQKAARMLKRLKKQMPEFAWSTEDLTSAEALQIKKAPFVVQGSNMAVAYRMTWTGRSWRQEEVDEAS